MTVYKPKLKWNDINTLFSFYSGLGKYSHRSTFIDEGLKIFPNLSADELCLIWQAFDRAAEEWQNNEQQ